MKNSRIISLSLYNAWR